MSLERRPRRRRRWLEAGDDGGAQLRLQVASQRLAGLVRAVDDVGDDFHYLLRGLVVVVAVDGEARLIQRLHDAAHVVGDAQGRVLRRQRAQESRNS